MRFLLSLVVLAVLSSQVMAAFPLRQSTASQEVPLGIFVDSTDGNTQEGGLTIANTDIKLFKTGATSLANKNSGGATVMSSGVYVATLDATDTNTAGPLVIYVHVAGALQERLYCEVYPAEVYDAMFGTEPLRVDVREFGGEAGAFSAGVPAVNLTLVNGGPASAESGVVPADVQQVNGFSTIDGYNLAQIWALIASNAAGEITGSEDNEPVLESLDGDVDRIQATVDPDGNRTIIIDVSEFDIP